MLTSLSSWTGKVLCGLSVPHQQGLIDACCLKQGGTRGHVSVLVCVSLCMQYAVRYLGGWVFVGGVHGAAA